MQALNKPFQAIKGATVSRTVTTTSANVAIPTVALGATAVRVVFSAGTANARTRSGNVNTVAAVNSAGTAGTWDALSINGTVEVFGIDATDTYMAAITDSGTCTVEFTFGYGA